MASRLVVGLALVVLGLVDFLVEVVLPVVFLAVVFFAWERLAEDFLAVAFFVVAFFGGLVADLAVVLDFGRVLEDSVVFVAGFLTVAALAVVFRAEDDDLGGVFCAGETLLAAVVAVAAVFDDVVVFRVVDVVFLAAALLVTALAVRFRVLFFGGGGGGGGGGVANASFPLTLGMTNASSLRISPPFRLEICFPREARLPAGMSSRRSTFMGPRRMMANSSCASVTIAASATAPWLGPKRIASTPAP